MILGKCEVIMKEQNKEVEMPMPDEGGMDYTNQPMEQETLPDSKVETNTPEEIEVIPDSQIITPTEGM